MYANFQERDKLNQKKNQLVNPCHLLWECKIWYTRKPLIVQSKINHYSVESKLFQTFIYITFCKMGKEKNCKCLLCAHQSHILHMFGITGSAQEKKLLLLGFWFLDLHIWEKSKQVLNFWIPFTLLSTAIHQECICKVRIESH